jgi:hypothetical protein
LGLYCNGTFVTQDPLPQVKLKYEGWNNGTQDICNSIFRINFLGDIGNVRFCLCFTCKFCFLNLCVFPESYPSRNKCKEKYLVGHEKIGDFEISVDDKVAVKISQAAKHLMHDTLK